MKKNNKKKAQGFTLIEMAIVLVIIGLIIGAVLKGQDIITNARIKRFINFGRLGEISQWGYFDRNGFFASGLPALRNMTDWRQSGGHLDVGPADFYAYIYMYNSTSASKTFYGLVLLPVSDGAQAYVANDDPGREVVEYFKSFDTAIDGAADGTAGRVRSLSSAQAFGDPTTGLGNYRPAAAAASMTTSAWDATGAAGGTSGLLYWFDAIPSD